VTDIFARNTSVALGNGKYMVVAGATRPRASCIPQQRGRTQPFRWMAYCAVSLLVLEAWASANFP